MDIFSARVKWLREKRGLSQKEVAELVGMSPAGYGKIENGQREPSLEKLVSISTVLNESSDFLLGIIHFDKELNVHTQYIESLRNSINRIEELIKEFILKSHIMDIDMDFHTNNAEHLEYTKTRFNEIKTIIISQLEEIPYVPDELINTYKGMTP